MFEIWNFSGAWSLVLGASLGGSSKTDLRPKAGARASGGTRFGPAWNLVWPLCISFPTLGYNIGLGISPGCPARVSGWRVSVTTGACAGTRLDSRRLAADAICQEEASAPFIADTRQTGTGGRVRMNGGTGAPRHWMDNRRLLSIAGIGLFPLLMKRKPFTKHPIFQPSLRDLYVMRDVSRR